MGFSKSCVKFDSGNWLRIQPNIWLCGMIWFLAIFVSANVVSSLICRQLLDDIKVDYFALSL